MLTDRQQHCLRGIGIQVWSERGAARGELATGPVAEVAKAEQENPETGHEPGLFEQPAPAAEVPGEKPGLSLDIEDPAAEAAAARSNEPPALDTWDQIVDAIHACNACELSQNCTQKVPGVGNRDAALMIVGEGPGHDEDIRGEPFVGRSGQLLDRMLAAIGIARDQVYITNIVKCRPPNNRDPKPEEARACRTYLEAQIEQIAPRVILSVGRVSAHNLLGSSLPVGKLIQEMHQLPGTDIPVKVTYHPAYLLRNPSAKAIAWQDLKLLHKMLQ